MASNSDTLTQFAHLSPTEPFSILQKLLWPTGDPPAGPTLHGPECRGLSPYIDTYNTNDPSSTIDYIDLKKHPGLRVHGLTSVDTLIVRRSYVEFLAEVEEGYRFYVTGERGIGEYPPPSLPFTLRSYINLGKSVGASYFLLHLLACGQSVFFVPEPDVICYFSDSGVQVLRERYADSYMSTRPTKDAARKSWVLLAVDAVQYPEWYPHWWIALGVGLVYTALLKDEPKHWFTTQFVADIRVMQPWSAEEKEALSAECSLAHALLWPTDSDSDRLTPYIHSHLNARYLDIALQPQLEVHKLQLQKYIIQDEYDNFLAELLQRGTGRFFLTGHPGIGKSVGAVYFLFRLIAMGQPVFFLPNAHEILSISESGVQILRGPGYSEYLSIESVKDLIRKSWVLVDVDNAFNWIPDHWIRRAKFVVWTAALDKHRMHHFKNQIEAETWVMKPWSLEEIDAYTSLTNRDPQAVLARLHRVGPVARDLFSTGVLLFNRAADRFSLVKAKAIKNASHRMFLLKPGEVHVHDSPGNWTVKIERTEFSIDFLSDFVRQRAQKERQGLEDFRVGQVLRAFGVN
ncbi:hypothetical protein FB45DRAFT_1040292 [Roridomyces roridus]|uniref:Uncharacterized protein n=1 Tax=Roridomyces roridus TaxID=1738132 RepID=A0AAD7FAH1_9AGAR|nr:hypothetical protein FB45DRAFT_1040292 [Roridomyces roridus]